MLLGSKLLKHAVLWDADVDWAGAKVCRSLKELSSEFSLVWTESLDEIFSSSQHCSTPLTLTPAGPVRLNPGLSFPGLLNLTVFE